MLAYNSASCKGPHGCRHLAAGYSAAALALASGMHTPYTDAHCSVTCVIAGARDYPGLQPDVEQRQQPASTGDGEGSLQS